VRAVDPRPGADPHPAAGGGRAGGGGRAAAGSAVLAPVARTAWRVWGTSVTLLVQPAGALEAARRLLAEEIAATDAACSRFRPDSELARLNAAGGRTVPVSPRFMEALSVARRAAERTDGAVDPTVGAALLALGYDRDFDEVREGSPTRPLGAPPAPAAGWRALHLDARAGTATLDRGTLVDLGATAKALCADAAATRIATELGAGTLVDLGGDLAVAGPPPAGGWQVSVVEHAGAGGAAGEPGGCVVSVWSGGLATSGTTVRTWTRAGWPLHHIVDPATGWPAEPVWRWVTVAGGSCVEANVAATAAVVWGEEALFHVAQQGLAARFVRRDGVVLEVGGWPAPVPPESGTAGGAGRARPLGRIA
jgi:thiamine biosynthesis lipoprotein